MELHIQRIEPYPVLRNYIDQIFVFKSDGQLPSEDLKLIVPNGRVKLVIPFKNGLSAKIKDLNHISKENTITLIGIADVSSQVQLERNEPGENITVEFSPLGAYRFFNLKWSDIKNQIHTFSDISNTIASALENKLFDAKTIDEKLTIVQQFLVDQFRKTAQDPIFDYCVQKIMDSKGTIHINKLGEETGFSTRWLNAKFNDKIGTSPKNLASIIRFHQYHQYMVNNADTFFLQHEFYHFFYDQAHFIRDFKRFTGHTPMWFERQRNDYDTIFYKE